MHFHFVFARLPVIRPEFFIPIPVLSFLVFIPGLIRTLMLKDCLYERLYADHRDIWESLGRPCGWQWRPPGTWIAFPEIGTSLAWLSLTDPAWLTQAPELRELFHAYRAGLRRWNFVAMPTFAAGGLLFALLFFLFSPKGA
jgi:hypothetical protein